MGEVWRAYDLKLRVEVALKALLPALVEDAQALETLRQEVRSAREVISPNVCRVFDLEEIDNRELVSMEYIDGTTLQEILESRGPLDLDEGREIASQFLAGVEAIHRAGLVHQDLKPENIMITRSGRVVVMDFGIAKGVADRGDGVIAGTPAYMAPEQARGESGDARADVFSAAVVLAEMVAPDGVADLAARRVVWEGVHRDPPEIADTPWRAVLEQALSKRPKERFPTAAALIRALEQVAERVQRAEDLHPYPGLAAFTAKEAEYFFGRELEVEALWKKLRRPHLTALIGPSGAGKTSFLNAGLLPVMPAGWRALVTSPGNRPFMALAAALAQEFEGDAEAQRQLLAFEDPEVAVSLIQRWRHRCEQGLVVVDQFEELFTQNPIEVQHGFSKLLSRLVLEADTHVLLSMRDDFLFNCQSVEPLHPIFSELTPLGILSGSGLRRALVQPALRCGYRFEGEDLVEEMVGEVSGEKGALPMLAFAAARLWEQRDPEEGLLTRKAYEQIGGVGGALAQHAEATLERIGRDRAPFVRELFRNLVTAQGTRTARDRDELLSVFEPSDRAGAEAVLDALVDSRLFSSYEVPDEEEGASRRHIEIVHESLLTAWPRLVRWQTQDQEGAQLRDELRQAAQMWEQHHRSDDLLWTGTAFQEFQLWRARYPGGLTGLEGEFTQAMTGLALRRKRRRRVAVTGAFVLLLVVLGIIGTLWRRSVAEQRRSEAQKLLALANAEFGHYPTAALAYARASLELVDTPEARWLALDALWHGAAERILKLPGGQLLSRHSFSPDGQWLALPSAGSVQVASPRGELTRILDGLPGEYQRRTTMFDRQSELLATWTAVDPEVRIWSLAEQKVVRTLAVTEVGSPVFWDLLVPSDHLVTQAGKGQPRRAWPLAGGQPLALPGLPTSSSICIADLARDRDLCTQDGRVVMRPLASDNSVLVIGDEKGSAGYALAAPEGDRVVSVDQPREDYRIWTLAGGSPRLERILKGAEATPTIPPAFDPQGSRLVWGSSDKRAVYLWNLEGPPDSWPVVYRVQEVEAGPRGALHPGGEWLTASYARAVSFWPIHGGESFRFDTPKYQFDKMVFTPDSRHLAAGRWLWPLSPQAGPARQLGSAFPAVSPDGRCFALADRGRAWLDCPPAAPRTLAEGLWPAMALAFDASGRYLALGTYGEEDLPERPLLRVLDLDTREMRRFPITKTAEELGMGPIDLHFAAAGRLVAGGLQGVHLWDVVEGSRVVLHEAPFARSVVSLDGRFVLVGEQAQESWNRGPFDAMTLYDLEGNNSRRIVAHGQSVRSMALGPSGEILVTGGEDGAVRVSRIHEEVPQLLLGHESPVIAVAVSPDKRWVASEADDGIRVWPMPDLDKPPFHTLPYEKLLGRLDRLTNLRAIRDESSSTGWKLEIGPFPGWEEVPEW
jgi:WD40 repeat protein